MAETLAITLSSEEEDLLHRSKKKSKVGDGPKDFFSRKVVSYKDVCLGVNGVDDGYCSFEQEYDFWEKMNEEEERAVLEEMEEVEEDNLKILCPMVKLSKEERIGACIPWKRAIIIKLLGKRMSLKFLQGRLQRLWQPKERMEVIDIDNDYFLVRFTDWSDLNKVYEGVPWVIMGHYLVVQRWKPEFLPYEEEFKRVFVWIGVPILPIEYYDDHILWRIGDVVGHTIKIDPNTLKQHEDDLGTSMVTECGKFARICVEVDLRKVLISRFGHKKECCPLLAATPKDTNHQPDPNSEPAKEMGDGAAGSSGVPVTEEVFGPWMMVQRKSHGRNQRGLDAYFNHVKNSGPSIHTSNLTESGSRFALLNYEEPNINQRQSSLQAFNSLSGQEDVPRGGKRTLISLKSPGVQDMGQQCDGPGPGTLDKATGDTLLLKGDGAIDMDCSDSPPTNMLVMGSHMGMEADGGIDLLVNHNCRPPDSVTMGPEPNKSTLNLDRTSHSSVEADTLLSQQEEPNLGNSTHLGHNQFVHMKVHSLVDSNSWFLTCVYGSPGWFAGTLMPILMSRRRPPYTWEWRNVKECLDRVLCNGSWRMLLEEASVYHLPTLKSDHKPLLIKMKNDQTMCYSNRPFRFVAAWLADSSFNQVVKEAWRVEGSWTSKVKTFQSKAMDWNVNCFGGKRIVEALTKDDGTLLVEKDEVQKEVVGFFKQLYCEEGVLLALSMCGFFPTVSPSKLLDIQSIPLDSEIRTAIFSMGPLKTPGPDGLNPLFYQSQWDKVGSSLCEMVRDIFLHPGQKVNATKSKIFFSKFMPPGRSRRVTLAKSVLAALPTYTMQTMLLPKSVCNELERMHRNFIWDSTESRQWHSIAWDKLRRPKIVGGLGFKSLCDFNQSMMMKLGWGLVHSPEAYWVRILRSKYHCGEELIPRVSNRPKESLTWCGIRQTWPHILTGLRWVIGDGKSTAFWEDRWLHSGVKLRDHCLVDFPEIWSTLLVCDFFDSVRGWKLDLLWGILPDAVVAEIAAHPYPDPELGADTIVWGGTSDGKFTTKSAYNLIASSSSEVNDPVWHSVWSSSVLLAELRGIETALRIVWEHEYKQLWLESDSLTAVRLIDKGITHDHPYAHILKQISSWRQRPWCVVISHTFRERNRIADCLANMSHSRNLGLHMLSDPLESVVAFCGRIL
ncbi:Ribonuclease H domain [Sesbania bispinosa]|nr:Ribonuclease H domain [Sesbania bispinosa]